MSLTDADAEIEPLDPATPVAAVETPLSRFLSDYFESWIATAALAVLVLIVCLAVLAPLLAPQNPYNLARGRRARQPPAAGIGRHGRLHVLAWHRRRRAATC